MKPTLVEHLMSRSVLTLKESDTIEFAHVGMDLADVRHLPVTDESGKLTGIITSSDLLAARANSPRALVRERMKKDVQSVHPKVSALTAVRMLIRSKIGCLPVVDDQKTIVGIVTETDFLRIAEGALIGGRYELPLR